MTYKIRTPRIEPTFPAWEAWILNYWVTRKVPETDVVDQ